MIRITLDVPQLVCIQIPESERQFVVNELLTSKDVVRLSTDRGWLELRLGGEFIVNASDTALIAIVMPWSDRIELADAITEHIAENGELPLDHSLETLGARIVPDAICDVVIETVKD